MPEISDDELRILQGSRQLMDKLLKNPKTQVQAQKLIKEAIPDANIQDPEDHPMVKELRSTQDELRKLQKSLAEERADSELDTQFSTLRQHGYQDEGIDAIKKIMVERKIPNALDAAAVWEKRNPPKSTEAPSSYMGSSFLPAAGNDEDLKLLYSNEDAWAEQELAKIFQEHKQAANQIRY